MRTLADDIADRLNIIRMAVARFRPWLDVEDAAQEAAARALAAAHTFQYRSGLNTWLTQVARMVCLEHLRADRRRNRKTTLYAHETRPSARRLRAGGDLEEYEGVTHIQTGDDFEVRASEATEGLKDALWRLPSVYRIPLQLALEGRSCQEIATITNSCANTVKTRMKRGRVMLRKNSALRRLATDML